MDGTDPWALLGLTPGASSAECKAAFRRRSKDLHPDRGGDERAFAELVGAYRRLESVALVQPPAPARRHRSRGANPFEAARPAEPSVRRVDLTDVPTRVHLAAGGSIRRAVWATAAGAGAEAGTRGAEFERVLRDALAA